MTKEFESKNNFEQNLSSETFYTTIGTHLKHLQEHRARTAEKTRSYPATYENYLQLSLNDRLSAAVSIFRGDAPEARWARWRDEMPQQPPTFDISSLSGIEDGSVKASIAHSQGAWTNALNDTHIDKLPHLSIDITTSLDGKYITEHFADLEVLSHYEEKGYKNYTFTHASFQVLERGFKRQPITDPDHPLFRDVVTIVDVGVGILYREKLSAHIAKLGTTTIHATNQEESL